MKIATTLFVSAALAAHIQAQSSSQPSDLSIPPALTNTAGVSFTLAVTDNGQPYSDPTASYQWACNGVTLDGATNAAYEGVYPATYYGTNLYTVQATLTNGRTTLTSTVYTVTMPAIENYFQTTGGDVTFQVVATGGLLNYQWHWHNQWEDQAIPGATNADLEYTNAFSSANAGYYWAAVANPAGVASTPTNGLLLTKPVPVGQYEGLFYNTDIFASNLAPACFGHFLFSVDQERRILSGSLQNGAKKYPFAGSFGIDHSAVLQIPSANPIWTLDMQLLTTNEFPQITGYAANSASKAPSQLYGIFHYYSAKTPFPNAGKYTIAFQKQEPTNYSRPNGVPDGYGYASMAAQSTGTVTLIGQTADGTSISQSAGLSQHGDYPLYLPAFGGRGLLTGWICLSNSIITGPTNNIIAGAPILWFKGPGAGDANYKQGFAEICDAAGSLYVPSQQALSYSNGVATFTGGDLTENNGDLIWDFVQVVQKSPDVFVPETGIEQVKLTLSRSTGVITGTYADCVSTKPVKSLMGAVLQEQGWAAGYFLNSSSVAPGHESGLFTLTEDAYQGD
jgi:hypothetical protein